MIAVMGFFFMKRRVIAFIDGFNLYHSIANLADNSLKWLDIVKLVNRSLSSNDELIKVCYFTALLDDINKRNRHQNYIRALETLHVEVHYGRFRLSSKRSIDKGWVKVLEEKETDVNIAIQMIRLAFQDQYDQAVLISADSDQVPTLKLITTELGKEVRLLLPPNSKADELKTVSTVFERLTRDKIESCKLPIEIELSSGKKIKKPLEW
ncbi:NYN domain-containing protein [bacterium]|nr:MAG: NYN domain-containing protein [bacterium]